MSRVHRRPIQGNDEAGRRYRDDEQDIPSLGYRDSWQARAYKLLLCYFGANIGYRAIRYDLKCRDAAVIEIRGKVYRTLDTIHEHAMVQMEERCEERKLIALDQYA